MGYNHAAAFLPESPRPKFFPPFEGPVVGLPDTISFPKGKTQLLNLRAKWLETFIGHLAAINPQIPRDVAVEWVNVWFPRTADDLSCSLMTDGPLQLAMRLADAWKVA